MFHIVKNSFITERKVWYEDEVSNKLLVIQKKDMVTFKLRPVIVGLSCNPFNVPWPPVEGARGGNLEFNSSDQEMLNSDEVRLAIDGLTKIVSRWMHMLSDISQFGLNNLWIMNANRNLTEEELNKMKVLRLSQYEELEEALKIFTEDELEFAKKF